MTIVTMSKRAKNAKSVVSPYITLRTRADFVRLRQGAAIHSQAFVLQGRKRRAGINVEAARLGFTVSKKNGNSVQRNRIKRRLREAAKSGFLEFANSDNDYAIIAKPGAINRPFNKLEDDLRIALNSLHQKHLQSNIRNNA